MSTAASYNLGAISGFGSSTRIYNNCLQTSSQPWNCINQFLPRTSSVPSPPVPPPPVPGITKAVFLLELSAGITENDLAMQQTVNYYWNTYPQEFSVCPIVDTQGDINITLDLLNKYYSYGFRNFVGFSRSTILNEVLDWFNQNPDATGISSTSTAAVLDIPKNIYRMTANDNYLLQSITTYLENQTVNYIYEGDELAAISLITEIQQITGITLNQYPISSSDPIGDLNALSSLNSGHTGEIMLVYLFINRQSYLDLFKSPTPVLTYTNTQYDMSGIGSPSITNSTALNNNYYTTLFKGIQTSILWRNGYYTLGGTNFSIVSLNILLLLNQLVSNESVNNLNSHFGPLIFNSVTKDINYFSFLIEKYNGTSFVNTNLYIKDFYLGEYTANIVSAIPPTPSIISISPNQQFNGKAIALLDLNYPSELDEVMYQSLYYFWFSDSSFPKFPITDISGYSNSQLASLLTTYYGQGYRLFLGPNFGDAIASSDIQNWFKGHPDAICLCLFAGVGITNPALNIYRFSPLATNILNLLIAKIIASQKVYFIYDSGTPIGIYVNSVLTNLCASLSKPYKSFAITAGAANLTVANMLDFFGIDPSNNPVTVNDVNIILSNNNLQNYLNLYNNTLMNQIVAPTYIASGQVDPTVPVTGTVLNENLYTLDITYPSTSYLWNNNRIFLTEEFSSSTDSLQLLNALKMMQYILLGKDTKLLGSHVGTLQFNTSDNTIKFPSVLTQQYQSTPNKFVNYEINFTDPLLGTFNANFI